MLKIANKYFNNTNKIINKANGFTLLEAVIAIGILILVFGTLTILCTTSVKTAKFEEHLVNLNALVSQKTSNLFASISSEITKFPAGATQVGSLNADTPITGYYDLLNESGCIVSTTNGSNLDCSGTIVANPSRNLTPKFRRQWTIRKDFPNSGDITIGVVVVYDQTNQIIKSLTTTKSDNVSSSN